MIEHTCENCGKKFMAYASNHRKYCSKECAANKNWQSREKAKKTKILCWYCGKEFELNSCETRVKENKVHYCSAECRNNGQRKGKEINCKYCGNKFYTTRNDFCSKECWLKYKKEHYEHKLYKENGYICRYVKDYNKKGNVKEHRYIMEQLLERKLKPNEIVHHIDGNKENNDINNLQVMTRGEHSKLHREKELSQGKKLFKSN